MAPQDLLEKSPLTAVVKHYNSVYSVMLEEERNCTMEALMAAFQGLAEYLNWKPEAEEANLVPAPLGADNLGMAAVVHKFVVETGNLAEKAEQGYKAVEVAVG